MALPSHEHWMQKALALSWQQKGRTGENPAVGCVIVKDDKIIGQGVTSDGGRPHGETNALQVAGKAAKDASVYVALEPCSHYGQTAPCANALIDAGIGQCVIAVIDPDPRVHWRGAAQLQEAGIDTMIGLCEDDARALNADFFARVKALD